jgi:hypothetical protein
MSELTFGRRKENAFFQRITFFSHFKRLLASLTRFRIEILPGAKKKKNILRNVFVNCKEILSNESKKMVRFV